VKVSNEGAKVSNKVVKVEDTTEDTTGVTV
jgi:hypothetical protein